MGEVIYFLTRRHRLEHTRMASTGRGRSHVSVNRPEGNNFIDAAAGN